MTESEVALCGCGCGLPRLWPTSRWRRGHNPRHAADPADRFWPKVHKSDGCWEWTAGRFPSGYGAFSMGVSRKAVRAHRMAWELAYGPIPDGLVICHVCDNPPCVRPDHLALGTVADNNGDTATKGRTAGGRPAFRLTDDDVRAIRRIYAEGTATPAAIAREWGISGSMAWKIIRRQRWAHVE